MALLEMPLCYSIWASVACWSLLLALSWSSPFQLLLEMNKQVYDVFMGFVFAVVTSCFGVAAELWTEPACSVGPTFVRGGVIVLVGYLLTHLVLVLVCDVWLSWRRVDLGNIFHHVYILVCFGSGYYLDVGIWFACTLLCNELSSPFLNVFWYLQHTGKKETNIFFVNGLFLVVVFFLCRIVFIPFSVYQFASVGWCLSSPNTSYSWGSWVMILGYSVHYTLNLTWFHKLVVGAWKAWNSKVSGDNGDEHVAQNAKKK